MIKTTYTLRLKPLVCNVCGATEDEFPDSRVNELKDYEDHENESYIEARYEEYLKEGYTPTVALEYAYESLTI